MARLPNPIEHQRLTGQDKVHPERYGKETPKSELPLGEYPQELATDPAQIWFEVSSLAIPGVLTGADRLMMEIACNLLSEYRKDPVGFAVGKYTHLISCLARFGMSPSDRTRLGVGKQDDEDDFEPL